MMDPPGEAVCGSTTRATSSSWAWVGNGTAIAAASATAIAPSVRAARMMDVASSHARHSSHSASYGVTTGHSVAPDVVQATRPWMAGEMGVFAAMWSARTWSMMSRVVIRLLKFG